MTDSIEVINTLLGQAEAAHATYEATVLGGVYDQDWPRWYAGYLVDHGIGELIGHPVTTDALAEFLAGSLAEFTATEPPTRDTWAEFTARRIETDL